LSVFSDNVALTYRKDLRNDSHLAASNASATRLPAPDALPAQDPLVAQAGTEPAREVQLFAQAQQAGLMSQLPFLSTAPPSPKANVTATTPVQDQSESAKSKAAGEVAKPAVPASHDGKEYVLFEGTVLEALLINRLDGTFAGPVSCLLSNNVYSHDRQRLLIPAGSKIVGEASKVD